MNKQLLEESVMCNVLCQKERKICGKTPHLDETIDEVVCEGFKIIEKQAQKAKVPKDRQIMITHKYGTNIAIWSEVDEKFAYANIQYDFFEGKQNMAYFENEYVMEKDIVSWREI